MAHTQLFLRPAGAEPKRRRGFRAVALVLGLLGASSAVVAMPSFVATGRMGARALAGSTKAPFVSPSSRRTRNEAQLASASALKWMPSMPQTCNDDFECNGGKANFPLQCVDMFVAKICVDPDDFQQSSQVSSELAYVPLPVRADEPRQPGQ
eukprot:gb/GFBE01031765.1/.p1 GENE.gb/GFBE01031765.1/~~gb/GFBE01031765.1/.p1  ORF type:complete len:152 (+),score=9.73 gb/GFBE01031765.1/:1-456(+)